MSLEGRANVSLLNKLSSKKALGQDSLLGNRGQRVHCVPDMVLGSGNASVNKPENPLPGSLASVWTGGSDAKQDL